MKLLKSQVHQILKASYKIFRRIIFLSIMSNKNKNKKKKTPFQYTRKFWTRDPVEQVMSSKKGKYNRMNEKKEIEQILYEELGD